MHPAVGLRGDDDKVHSAFDVMRLPLSPGYKHYYYLYNIESNKY